MQQQNFTASFLFEQTPEQVFEAITNVRGWWSAALEGTSEKLNDEFIYRYKDIHYSKQLLVEVVPGKKVVWLVTESSLSFVQQKDEWNNTRVSFEILQQGNKTLLVFTHIGLVPKVDCYDGCSKGWSYYLNNSLVPLITTGKGNPDAKAL